MMARAAVRDAGRVLDVPYGTVDRIAKLIPEGPKVYLEESLKPGAELRAAYDAEEQVQADRRSRAPARGARAAGLDPRRRRRDRRPPAHRVRARSSRRAPTRRS